MKYKLVTVVAMCSIFFSSSAQTQSDCQKPVLKISNDIQTFAEIEIRKKIESPFLTDHPVIKFIMTNGECEAKYLYSFSNLELIWARGSDRMAIRTMRYPINEIDLTGWTKMDTGMGHLDQITSGDRIIFTFRNVHNNQLNEAYNEKEEVVFVWLIK